MNDDLQTELARSLSLQAGDLLGAEAMTRERWRVWTMGPDARRVLLYLMTLRSNAVERAFDAQLSLTLAWCRQLGDTDPIKLQRQVWQLVLDYTLFWHRSARIERAWWYELPTDDSPLCDPADRLWGVGADTGPEGKPQSLLFVVWLHEQVLYLAVEWSEGFSSLLARVQDEAPLFSLNE